MGNHGSYITTSHKGLIVLPSRLYQRLISIFEELRTSPEITREMFYNYIVERRRAIQEELDEKPIESVSVDQILGAFDKVQNPNYEVMAIEENERLSRRLEELVADIDRYENPLSDLEKVVDCQVTFLAKVGSNASAEEQMPGFTAQLLSNVLARDHVSEMYEEAFKKYEDILAQQRTLKEIMKMMNESQSYSERLEGLEWEKGVRC